MQRLLISLVFLSGLPGIIRGDGKFYFKDQPPPGVPYQQALIIYDPPLQTMILQSSYQSASLEHPQARWVVPLPAVPRIGILPGRYATELFSWLNRSASPDYWRLRNSILTLFLIASVVPLVLLIFRFSRRLILPERTQASWKEWLAASGIALAGVGMIGPNLFRFSYGAGYQEIKILHHQTAGIYDVEDLIFQPAPELNRHRETKIVW